jgi:hypothetical protein
MNTRGKETTTTLTIVFGTVLGWAYLIGELASAFKMPTLL